MRKISLVVMLAGISATAPMAQEFPYDFRQDTPHVPGQIVEPPREKLRLTPKPLRLDRSSKLGLPSSGPKGIQRSINEPHYAPPIDR